MCNPPLHTEKSPLLGLQFIEFEFESFPSPQLNTNRRNQTTPTSHQRRQQEQLQNEQRQLLFLVFLIAALLLAAAPILCIIKGTAGRLFFGGGGRADKVFNERNVLEQKSSPFLRHSYPSVDERKRSRTIV